MLRILAWILGLFVFVAALVLGWLNYQPIEFDYVLGTTSTNLVWALVVTLIAGWVLGLMTSVVFLFRLRHENRQLRRRLSSLETEVDNLRSLPIRDAH